MKSRGFGWVFKSLFILAVISTVLVAIAGSVLFWHFSKNLPDIITVADYRPLTVTRVYARAPRSSEETEESKPEEKVLIGEFYKERRYLIPYEKIPEVVVQAFISAEDDRFFDHQGVNLASILRASIANFRAGHVVQGGSTITQQVAKSLLLTSERSFVRKIKEFILASRMEQNLTKQQILYLYLNQIYLGHGAYGVQAASRVYYDKDVSELSVAEAAILAGMPQAPGKYSPNLNPKRAKERQLYVLRRMYENKYITQNQMSEEAAKVLKIYGDRELNESVSPYYVEHIRRYLVEKYGDKKVYEDGLEITLPSSVELFKVARKSLVDGLHSVDKRMGYRGPIKHLKSMEEIENELRSQRLKLIERKLGFHVLMPDGKLEAIESVKHAGMSSESELLDLEESYPAVVTSVDDKKKAAGVMIGTTRAELPLDQMKWAKSPEPKLVSKVVRKGDVVLVKIEKKTEDQVVVSLDQEPVVQGALFSIEASTGNVLAMEGGLSFKQSEFNRATQALRQPGSAYKPMIFSAAIEKGFTPASIIVDSPIVYEDADTGKWKPANFEEKFYGDTTLRSALIKSRNVPTIKIVQAIQVPYLIEFSRRIGMNSQFNADLSISLGSGTVSLADLTRVYSVYPRLGRKVDPIYYDEIKDRDGKILEQSDPKTVPDPATIVANANASMKQTATDAASQPASTPKPGQMTITPPNLPQYPLANDPDQVLDPRVAYIATHLMKEVVNYGTGHEAKSLNRPAAGKTGTTNDYLDAWFMGFTPNVVTGVWVGFDNQKSLGSGETGAKAALPIWLGFMKEAVKNYPPADFAVPPGVVFASIHPVTGKLAPSNSSNSIKEAFIEGTQPTEMSSSSGSSNKTESEFFKEDIE